ncbi:MAG: biotin transporter BioY [Butyrivibrio sp.]|jgi:biotin transport system substrate-specific component|nr:biotin transporter BioY [Butyrivibrio sp.]MBQ7430190.1 biotin transporter BioY [Butyrivibrio sp.]
MSQTTTATTRENSSFQTIDIVYIGIFAALLAICSWISIPLTVPVTLQTFGVFVACALLGGKRGTVSIIVWILLGAVGAPVFAGFSGGMGVLLGSTGGYILGFIFTGLIMWAFERFVGTALWMKIVSMVLGLAVCYTFGTIWFMYVYGRANGAITLAQALAWCITPFLIPDACKIVLAAIISSNKQIRKVLHS